MASRMSVREKMKTLFGTQHDADRRNNGWRTDAKTIWYADDKNEDAQSKEPKYIDIDCLSAVSTQDADGSSINLDGSLQSLSSIPESEPARSTVSDSEGERRADYQKAMYVAQLQGGGRDHKSMPIDSNSQSIHCQRYCPSAETMAQQQAFREAQLNWKAKELDAYAAQLMAQAMKAKAEVLRMKSQASEMMVTESAVAPPPGLQAETSVENAQLAVCNVPENERTTIMLRNLPNDYSRAMLLELLSQHGLADCFDFVYLPMDTKRKVGLGYGFVNFTSNVSAQKAFSELSGFADWKITGSTKVLEVAWGNPLQGLEAHVERYRNSPMMHPDVADEFKPLLFKNGTRIAFPPPTQKLRAPRKSRDEAKIARS